MNQSYARIKRLLGVTATAGAILHMGGWTAKAEYVQTNLVSDLPDLAATITDSNLKNPWGISHNAASPFWVSDQVTGVATLYNVTGSTNVSANPLVVTMPNTGTGPQGPTGQVANTNTASFIVNGASARFMFANLNGTISAFIGGTSAVTVVPASGSNYTGLAINGAQTRLYAASATGVSVFDSGFSPILPGTFANPQVSALGLVPFNVQAINGKIYVTYAPSGRTNQQNATEGQGAVAIFDENGNLLQNLVTMSKLASPWGITVAPANFGQFAGDILVGNFSFKASEINAFDATNGTFEGTIPINVGGNAPGGLWALGFGNGGNNGSPSTLYFTDGVNGEADGLFGAINAPGPVVGAGIPGLVASVAGFLAWARRRRSRDHGRVTAQAH
jgi:uncharacterized protein (TIGR03118 family)